MPSETIQAVVLRYANYREHDRMLSLLSPEKGRVDALSRGCRRPKSPLLTGSEMLVHGEFVLFRSSDRYTLTSCTLTDAFYPLRLDAYRLTCATYLSQLALAAAQPDQPARELFALLLQGLYHLTYCPQEDALAAVDVFLLRYAMVNGYRPRLNHCVRCGKALDPAQGAQLELEAGGLCCPACARTADYRLTTAQAAWMRQALRSGEWLPAEDDPRFLFACLRRYVESRLDTAIKASRLLP